MTSRILVLAALAVLCALAPAPPVAAGEDAVGDHQRAEEKIRAQIAALEAAVDALGKPSSDPKSASGVLTELIADLRRRLEALEKARPPAPVPPLPPLPPNFEWTDLKPSADSRMIYVSTSDGNDANDGSSPAKAVRGLNVAAARRRRGFPDWVLLKRGDVWNGAGTFAAFLPDGEVSGRSAAEPQVITSYGSGGARPVLIDGRYRALDGVKHVAVVGLEFRLSGGSGKATWGAQALGATVEDLLLEDCLFSGYGLMFDGQGKRMRGLRLRGCVVEKSVLQGALFSAVDGLVIEGCVFDRNGWREGVPGMEANGFNHNVYIQTDCTDVTFRQNISARASSHGVQQRPGGLTEDNLFLQNPIAMNSFHAGAVRWNVVEDGRDFREGGRGFGIWLGDLDGTMTVEGNILHHQVTGSQARAFEFDQPTGTLSVKDNIVWKWDAAVPALPPIALYWSDLGRGTVAVSGNVFRMGSGLCVQHDHARTPGVFTYTGNSYLSGMPSPRWFYEGGALQDLAAWRASTGEAAVAVPAYPDPERTIATYMKSLGGQPSLEAFMAEACRQSKANWRVQFTAKGANNYFREGFGLVVR